MKPNYTANILFGLAILFVAFAFRSYTVSRNLPYFYDEDEAHHYNRTVNMVKTGELNPHYFHKPSLHFYLRMPVVWASYLWSKHKGYLSSLEDIRTNNRYGLGTYAFTASHEGIVKWNRAFSLLLSLCLILLTFVIAYQVTSSLPISVAAGLLASCSPALIEYSSVIGVDVLMSMFCCASVYAALRFVSSPSNFKLFLSAALAGLAISSKYNAAPVIAVPIIALFVSERRVDFGKSFLAGLTTVLFFFLASPFILVTLHTFIKDVSYEVWHYGVAGHAGHSANPGLDQIVFYSKWFANEGFGFTASIFALFGLLILLVKPSKESWVLISLPILFFGLMIAQKTNFVRNMLVMIPFLSIFAAIGIERLCRAITSSNVLLSTSYIALVAIACIQPTFMSLENRQESLNTVESRRALAKWFFINNEDEKETAISGELLVPREIYSAKNATTVDEKTKDPLDLYLLGYDRLIMGDGIRELDYSALPYLKLEQYIPGEKGEQRIVKNPAINILAFDKVDSLILLVKDKLTGCSECHLRMAKKDGKFLCGTSDTPEDYCWVSRRLTQLAIENDNFSLPQSGIVKLEIEIMSPWENQELALTSRDHSQAFIFFTNKSPGKWQTLELEVPADAIEVDPSNQDIKLPLIYTPIIKSPFKNGIGEDRRRLGFAIRSVVLR